MEHIFSAIDSSGAFDSSTVPDFLRPSDLRCIVYDATLDAVAEEVPDVVSATWTDQWREAGSLEVTATVESYVAQTGLSSDPAFVPWRHIVILAAGAEVVAAGWVATVSVDDDRDTFTIRCVGHEEYLNRYIYEAGSPVGVDDPFDLIRDYLLVTDAMTTVDATTRGLDVTADDYLLGITYVGEGLKRILNDHAFYKWVPTVSTDGQTFRWNLYLQAPTWSIFDGVVLESQGNCDLGNVSLDGTGVANIVLNGDDYVALYEATLREDSFTVNEVDPGDTVFVRPSPNETIFVGSDRAGNNVDQRVTSRTVAVTDTRFTQKLNLVPVELAP